MKVRQDIVYLVTRLILIMGAIYVFIDLVMSTISSSFLDDKNKLIGQDDVETNSIFRKVFRSKTNEKLAVVDYNFGNHTITSKCGERCKKGTYIYKYTYYNPYINEDVTKECMCEREPESVYVESSEDWIKNKQDGNWGKMLQFYGPQ